MDNLLVNNLTVTGIF